MVNGGSVRSSGESSSELPPKKQFRSTYSLASTPDWLCCSKWGYKFSHIPDLHTYVRLVAHTGITGPALEELWGKSVGRAEVRCFVKIHNHEMN